MYALRVFNVEENMEKILILLLQKKKFSQEISHYKIPQRRLWHEDEKKKLNCANMSTHLKSWTFHWTVSFEKLKIIERKELFTKNFMRSENITPYDIMTSWHHAKKGNEKFEKNIFVRNCPRKIIRHNKTIMYY